MPRLFEINPRKKNKLCRVDFQVSRAVARGPVVARYVLPGPALVTILNFICTVSYLFVLL